MVTKKNSKVRYTEPDSYIPDDIYKKYFGKDGKPKKTTKKSTTKKTTAKKTTKKK